MGRSMSKLFSVSKLSTDKIENRTVRFTLSTEDADRANDVVKLDGWKFENFLKNPVVFFNHKTWELPIARMTQIGRVGKAIVGDVEFATGEVYALAETVFQLVKGGFINAGSVGFRPLKRAWNEERRGVDFLEHELLEFSVVGIPCNANALRRVKSHGIALDDDAIALLAAQDEADAARAEIAKAAEAEARDASASNIQRFIRAHDMRAREFQLAQR